MSQAQEGSTQEVLHGAGVRPLEELITAEEHSRLKEGGKPVLSPTTAPIARL